MENPSYLTMAPVTQEIQLTELNLHLYMYQWLHGTPECNEKLVVNAGQPGFGSIYANDWTLYDGPAPNANLVARAQGVHNGCDINGLDSWFKGSTLKVIGSYKGGDADEWAVVGGTGEFGFAQGVGTFKVIKVMNGSKLREFNFRVRCPSSQKPMAPTPPSKLGPFGGKGGRAFDITDQPQRLDSVTIRSGNVIDSIAFSYTDQAGKKQDAGPWGGNGGHAETITFAPTETLKKVLITTGKFGGNVVVTSLTFVTDVKTYPTLGKAAGGPPALSIPDEDASVVGFFARAGSVVDAIGVYVAS